MPHNSTRLYIHAGMHANQPTHTFPYWPAQRLMPSLAAPLMATDADRGDGAGGLSGALRLLRVASARSAAAEERVEWVRSQLVGRDAEFGTPFGRRALTYADHTASGRALRYVEDYLLSEVLPFYGNTHTEDSHVGSKTTRMVRKATSYIKRCMGAGPDDALLFCGSGATAGLKRLQEVMGVAAPCAAVRERVAGSLRADERWVVFVGPYEHHSNLLSWRRSLADVVEVGADAAGLLDVDALRRALRAPEHADRPMLGSFSACSNVTGILADTRALARLLHQHGAFACFDFAASAPYVEIDMRSGELDGYDAVVLSPHKFVGGPGTPGILLINKALYRLAASPPSMCGGGTVAYVNGFNEEDTVYYDDVEEREDAGTPQIVQKVRASLAFWVKEFVGADAMALRERAYAEAALRRLAAAPGVTVLGNTAAKRLPIFSFLVYPPPADGGGGGGRLPLHGRFVARLLNDLFGVQARGGCACAGPYGHLLLGVDDDLSLRIRSAILKGYNGLKPGWTRVSFAYYLSKEEFKFILASIEFIAAYGHRFLPLYSFDWSTGSWIFRKQTFKYHIMKEELCVGSNVGIETKSAENSFEASSGKKFESYLESAKKIALSLPDTCQRTVRVPKGVDPEMILFRV